MSSFKTDSDSDALPSGLHSYSANSVWTAAVPGLEERVRVSILQRLSTSADFSEREIHEVSTCPLRVLPVEQAVDKTALERFRTLCQLYRCELPGSREITSHRPVLGPLIVFMKKILYRVMHSQLQKHFEKLQEFHLNLLDEHARLITREVTAVRESAER